MSTLFPNSIQDLDATRGSASDTLATVDHATHHQTEDDTIEALQAKVGVNNSAVTSSLDYKVSSTSSINPGHLHTLDNLSDVSTSGAVNGDFLSFNGSTWAPTTTSAPDASTTVKGVAKMSVAPVSASNPIAVGDNDGRVPTQSENDALQGTSGTPSNTNRYVTNDDTTGTGSILRASESPDTDIQTFTSTGANTWTKPTGAKKVLVQLWGGGGSGAAHWSIFGQTYGGGGGGGEYSERWLDASALGATETVTVGAGGSGVNGGNPTVNGNSGGNTTFGSHLTSYGGSGGGAPDGMFIASGGNGGSKMGNVTTLWGAGGYGVAGYVGIYSAGGGGYHNANGSFPGANSYYGGAGGGASGNSAGGISTYGGNGGAGVSGGGPGVSGSVPGGGGGAVYDSTSTYPSGAGGNGKAIVTTFF